MYTGNMRPIGKVLVQTIPIKYNTHVFILQIIITTTILLLFYFHVVKILESE